MLSVEIQIRTFILPIGFQVQEIIIRATMQMDGMMMAQRGVVSHASSNILTLFHL
jgi:hypothetical protein